MWVDQVRYTAHADEDEERLSPLAAFLAMFVYFEQRLDELAAVMNPVELEDCQTVLGAMLPSSSEDPKPVDPAYWSDWGRQVSIVTGFSPKLDEHGWEDYDVEEYSKLRVSNSQGFGCMRALLQCIRDEFFDSLDHFMREMKISPDGKFEDPRTVARWRCAVHKVMAGEIITQWECPGFRPSISD